MLLTTTSVPADEQWTVLSNDLNGWREPIGQCFIAGGAHLDPANPKRLVAEPGGGVIVNGKDGTSPDIYSRQEWGDVEVSLDFMIPRGSNSGVKMESVYEVQIFDSWKVAKPTGADCGGIYPRADLLPTYHYLGNGIPPRVNACRAPGEWQTLDIVFRAPVFDADGRKRFNVRMDKVVLNGQLIHDHIEVRWPTGNNWRLKEQPRAPLMLQMDHGPVAFRNVRVRALPVETNTAIVPTRQGGCDARQAEKVAAAHAGNHDLLLIGDSITHNLDLPPYREVWNQFYGPRNALDLGYSGGRTENILWNLQHGELDGQTPKVAVLLIGTNNCDDANYRIVHTPQQIAEGVAEIVKVLRTKTPKTKILLLSIFPRTNVYWQGNSKVERGSAEKRFATNQRASELIAQLADGKMVHFLNVNHVFLRLDGSIDPAMMPDLLHPSPKGALAWAKAMEPTLSQLMGEPSRDPSPPSNSALVPVSKLETDSYDWFGRHNEILKIKDDIDPEIVLIGDSITHFWAGQPESKIQNGPKAWQAVFGGRQVLNLGFGWDRIQNVLWRIDNGEFEGLHSKWLVINIGTNNFAGTVHARENTPAEIAEGVRAILVRIHARSPQTRIVLMGIFPRGQHASDPMRAKVAAVNRLLAEFGKVRGIAYLDIGPKFISSNGDLPQRLMNDFLHPTEAGYAVWAAALKPLLDENAKEQFEHAQN